MCIEAAGDHKTANVIAIAIFAVTDHAKYKSYLNRLRAHPNILKNAILGCKLAWESHTLAELVNDPTKPYNFRAMGKEYEDAELINTSESQNPKSRIRSSGFSGFEWM